MKNQKLYNELYQLREELRRTSPESSYKTSFGYYATRKQVICSDEALNAMAKSMPKRKEDLIALNSIGDTFMEKYSDEFFAIIDKYNKSDIKFAKVDDEIKKKLNILESRLVNVNRRNKLLYTGKLYNKNGIDLYSNNNEKNDRLLKFILNKKASGFRLFDAYNSNLPDEEKERQLKKYKALIRELNKEEKETGQNNAYIAYPYVIGKMQGDDFHVKAPLLLIPVKLYLDGMSIYINKEQEKDILWNSHFVLSHYKFLNKPFELKDNIYDYDEIKIEELIGLYDEHGINIVDRGKPFSKFIDLNKDSFPKFQNGEFYLLRNCVLGNFSFYSSYLQRDYKELQEQGEISRILSALLETFNEEFDEDDPGIFGFSDDEDFETDNKQREDKDIVYINNLNYSQEKVIKKILDEDSLVVQGPPGTGKSQTITSVIANFAIKDKKILMVSQKKAALDVIYSRLGEISDKALILHDVKDKESFYSQIKSIINQDTGYETENEIRTLSVQIDSLVEKLKYIGEKLYYTNQFGVPITKIYRENFKNSFLTDKDNINIFKDKLSINFEQINYEDLVKTYRMFDSTTLLTEFLDYKNNLKKYPWLNSIIPTLGFFEYEQLESDLKDYKELGYGIYRRSIFARLKTKKQLKIKYKEIIGKYFTINDGFNQINNYKRFLYKLDEINNSVSIHEKFLLTKSHFSTLSKLDTTYFEYIYQLVNEHEINKEGISKRLFDYIVYRMISIFESHNKSVYEHLEQFKSIIKTVDELIQCKQEVTKKVVKNKLNKKTIESLELSKRTQDFIRNINKEKRQLSATKFTGRFFYEMYNSIRVWLLTPEVISELLPMKNDMFDLVIFDEASQIYVEKALPAISRGKKLLITGDHMQLRPSSLGYGRTSIDIEEDDEIYESAAIDEDSLLDLARSKFKKEMLNYHYRSKYEELIAFSNFAFYNGRLYVSPNPTIKDEPPIKYVKVEDSIWDNRKNYKEALEVVSIVKNLILEENNQYSIGVISFNSSQRDLILDLLDEESERDFEFGTKLMLERERKENNEDYGFFVKNIENVQGDERDIIIFSTAYAKNESGRFIRSFGWLNQSGGENRLNVAISRAKHQIYLVTSINAEDFIVEDLKNKGPKLFRKYLEYARAVSNKDKLTAKSILLSLNDLVDSKKRTQVTFDSIFEEEVFNRLVENGYSVETQVGIGGYSIDLAIVDKNTNEYILGIECDGRTYHSSSIAKERDYYRQKYLESRGWRIHRIWSSDWWHNPEREILKITNLVNDYLRVYSQKVHIKEKAIGYEQILNKLRRSNLEYKQLNSTILFNLDKEIIEICDDGEMKSSFNDIRSFEILLKEIDAFIIKKANENKKKFIKSMAVDDELSTTIEPRNPKSKKETKFLLKEGEIQCICSHIFYESLGECPKCGTNTLTIIKSKTKNAY